MNPFQKKLELENHPDNLYEMDMKKSIRTLRLNIDIQV